MMPKMLPKPCAFPGCPALVESGQRYCEAHSEIKRQAEKEYDERRGNFRERGYTTQWDKLRRMKLARDPLCERCLEAGRVTPAQLVHHIKPVKQGGKILDMDNLMSVCRACHDELHQG